MGNRSSYDLPNLGEIHINPPQKSNTLNGSELFKKLKKAGNWTNPSLASEISIITGEKDFGEQTLKNWSRTKNFDKPNPTYREALFKIIKSKAINSEISSNWIKMLSLVWARDEVDYEFEIQDFVINSTYLSHLPSLFETDQALPISTTYVDLALAKSTTQKASPSLLELNTTLAERIRKRSETYFAIRQTPQSILDKINISSTLILGNPGAGKSSLLRSIARQISLNKWTNISISLFVEARVFWHAYTQDHSLDLITFALQTALQDTEHQCCSQYFLNIFSDKDKKVILLLDGLDEIAHNQEAVSNIYQQLRALQNSVSWVATSRPAGLMQPLNETMRCEMVNFNDESIEALIDNWGKNLQNEPDSLNTNTLKGEIFGSSTTREMAGNPFLLSALCYLKLNAPTESLPKSRVEIYELLVERIVFQANKKNKDVLSPPAFQALQEFSLHLYDQPNKTPTHIFTHHHWWQFRKEKKEGVDFYKHILPSRLITAWGEHDPYFHYLHLSIHEYVVARALFELEVPLTYVLEKRFHPSWRLVFQFYSALLWQRGEKDKFSLIIKKVLEEQDINSLHLITLAEIMTCAGIKNTNQFFSNFNIKEALFEFSTSDQDVAPEAMMLSLAHLDPSWCETQIMTDIEEKIDSHIAKIHKIKNNSKPLLIITFGKDLDNPLVKLSLIKTNLAKEFIRNVFWGDDHDLALYASFAYAQISTPSDRKKILIECKKTSISKDFTLRFFAYMYWSRRQEFSFFIEKILYDFSTTDTTIFNECLKLFVDLENIKTPIVLKKLAIIEAEKLSKKKPNTFKEVFDAILRMRGYEAKEILKSLMTIKYLKEWHEKIFCHYIIINSSHETGKNMPSNQIMLDAIATVCSHGRIPSDLLIMSLAKNIDENNVTSILQLCTIEKERLHQQMNPILCEKLLNIAERIYDKSIPNSNSKDTLLYRIINTLCEASFKPSKKLIRKILFHPHNYNKKYFYSAITIAGHIFDANQEKEIVQLLKGFLFNQVFEEKYRITLSIGRLDIEELFLYQDAHTAIDSLEDIATENNICIYDEFWVDSSGKKHIWTKKPKYVFITFENDIPDFFVDMAHELSQYGIAGANSAHHAETCIAAIVFGSTQQEKLPECVILAKKLQPEYIVFEVPLELEESDIAHKAKEIAIQLMSINHE